MARVRPGFANDAAANVILKTRDVLYFLLSQQEGRLLCNKITIVSERVVSLDMKQTPCVMSNV